MRDLTITITDNRTGESFTVEFAPDEHQPVEVSGAEYARKPFDSAGFTTYPALGNPDSHGPDGERCDCACHSLTGDYSYLQADCSCQRPADPAPGYPDC